MINLNIGYYNKVNMKTEDIKELGIKIGANRAEIKGKNLIFVFNVATEEDMQEQDCISSVYKQASDVLKDNGITISSVKANNFNVDKATNEVRLACVLNEDINKEYDNMEKNVMKDSISEIKKQLKNPWISQETKAELQDKLYDLQQSTKKVKDSYAPTARQGIDFVRGKDGDYIEIYFDGNYVGYGYNSKAIFNPTSDCPQAIIDYFLNNDWIVKSHKGVNDSADRELSIHEKAALTFSLRNDMGFHFDELQDTYPDVGDVDKAFYETIVSREKEGDEEFFDGAMETYFPSKEDYEPVLAQAVKEFDQYEAGKQIQDDGVYKQTNTGKSKWYANAREEREALAGAHRYHTPYPYSGSKEYDEKYFNVDNFEKILNDYFTSNPKNMPHNKDIPAPSYEAVIGKVLGTERLEQLLNNVLENTKFAEKKFYAKYPQLRESFFDPKIVRDYLTAADLVKMLRPEEKEKVIDYLRFPPQVLTKEQQKAYEMVHPKDPADQLNQDLERAKSQSRAIKENNDSEFSQLVRAYVKAGKGDYQDAIRDLLGSQRFADVLKLDAMFIPQVHFQMLTKEEQNKLLDFFKKAIESEEE